MAIRTNEDVAGRVRGIAAERRVSHAQLADTLGVTKMSMSRRMNGHTPFTAEELIRISEPLGVPATQFFEERA